MSQTPTRKNMDDAVEAAQLAVKLNLITQAQLDECIKIAQQVSSAGLPKTVNQVLVEKNYITQGQINGVLQSLGKSLAEIGAYDVLSKLGEGGMGAVYKVRSKTTSKVFALKTLKRDLAKDQEYLDRFQREVRNTFALAHPNIVSAVDAGVDKGIHYYVMEFVEGESLEDRIEREEKLSEQDSANIVIQVAGALSLANSHHIVHRDIKPANIMLSKDGSSKLCDLGIAKSTESGMTLTQTGFAVGSPHYISPEQARGDKAMDIRSDIYALGITLFQMVTGKLPFDADNPHAVVTKRLNENPPHPRKFLPTLSNRMSTVILKMIMRDPASRYQTPDEVISALVPIAKGLPDIDSTPHMAPPPSRKPAGTVTGRSRERERAIEKPKSKAMVVGIGIGAAALIAVIAMVALPRKPSKPPERPSDTKEAIANTKREEEERVKKEEAAAREEAERNKKQADVKYHDAQAKFSNGDYAGALALCEEALKLNPDHSEASQLKIKAGRAEGDRQRKETDARSTESQRKKEAQMYYTAASTKYKQGDYRGAIADASKALELLPGMSEASRLKSDAEKAEAERQRKETDARAEQERLQKEAMQYYTDGTHKFNAQDYDDALVAWQKALELNPALSDQLQPWIKQAKEKMQPIAEADRKKKEAQQWYAKGESEYSNSDYASAVDNYTKAIGLDPNYAEAYHGRGMAYDDMRKYKEAIADYDKATQLNPQHTEAYNNRGLSKYKSGDLAGAVADLDRAIKLNPSYAIAYFNRGAVKKDRGDKNGAIADWTQAIKINPAYGEKLEPLINALKQK